MMAFHSSVPKSFGKRSWRVARSGQRMIQVTVAEPSSSKGLPLTSEGSSVDTQKPSKSKCSRM